MESSPKSLKENSLLTNPSDDEEQGANYRPNKVSNKNKTVEWELRSVVGVFRHGDRTPKQKMKIKTKDLPFLKWFDGTKNNKKEVKLKTPAQLTKLLD